jgi:pyruvate/2-oxoglutarate/acetoin dehydrogenase E1 component
MDYMGEIKKAMEWLGEKKDTIFIGQTVEYDGSPMYNSLLEIDKRKKIEFPVAENMQMGVSIGMAINDFVPISVFPRMDFLICATDQLVNHLNNCEEMSNGEWKPKIIIRTQIGNTKPLYPGVQHCGDYYMGLKKLCKNIEIIKLHKAENIVKEYKKAYRRKKSTILIETPQGAKTPEAYKR